MGAGSFAVNDWPRNPRDAIELQKRLAKLVKIKPLAAPARIVAAIDLAHFGPARRPTHQAAGIIVYDMETKETVERHWIIRPVTFPYIPGLLSFREAPAAIELIEKVRTRVDVFLIDGQGLAHPRRFGIACHIGVLINHPTIGCAKSRLIGEAKRDLPLKRGAYFELVHNGEVVGSLLRTRSNVKPVYVSVGHLITLDECRKIILELADRYRLPEPARLAHNYAQVSPVQASDNDPPPPK